MNEVFTKLSPEEHASLASYLELMQKDAAADSYNAYEPSGYLQSYIASTGEIGFAERLMELIEASGLTEVEIYKRAHVERQLFWKIRNKPNYNPKKTTILMFAFALQLRVKETEELLSSAGYSLSKSTPADLIVRFFLEKKIYDLFRVNSALYEFNQPTFEI